MEIIKEDDVKNIKDENRVTTKKGRGRCEYTGVGNSRYTDDDLLNLLKQFYKETGKIPSRTDFRNNLDRYPSPVTYDNRFGNWNSALKFAGFDVDTVIQKGVLQSNYHKGRLAELIIFNSFKDKHKAIDFSGINCNSILDGLCPRGKTYDVKSAKLTPNKNYPDSRGWFFHFRNKQIEKIEYFYLVALDKNYENLYYIWLIPRELIEGKDTLYINFNNAYRYDKYLVDFNKCNLDFIDSIGKGD